jgi:hypothetical protein
MVRKLKIGPHERKIRNANHRVLRAIRDGYAIRKRPKRCQWCKQRRDLVAHHLTYDFPLYIVWWCRSCHMLHHAANRYKTDFDIMLGACPCGHGLCFDGDKCAAIWHRILREYRDGVPIGTE